MKLRATSTESLDGNRESRVASAESRYENCERKFVSGESRRQSIVRRLAEVKCKLREFARISRAPLLPYDGVKRGTDSEQCALGRQSILGRVAANG